MPIIKQTPPQPIKALAHKTNIWLLLIPIIFIAVLFILYVFAWEESIRDKQINNITRQSKITLSNLALNSQTKIKTLQTEIEDLKNQIKADYTLIETEESLDKYIEKNVTLTGEVTSNVLQHPRIFLATETHYEYHYIDTKYGQIQALRGDRIQCDDKIKITGIIHGIKATSNEGKNSYAGYYMFVENYSCIKSAEMSEKYSCQTDNDCILQQTSCHPCDCLEISNKENRLAIKCPLSEEEIICDAYCPLSEAKCIAGYCEAVEK